MSAPSRRERIEQLLADYVHAIDQDRLEDLPALFAEDGQYKILSRENVELNLPITLFHCNNINMLRDRILSLREANVYNPHYDRHVVGPIRMVREVGNLAEIEAGYALYQTTLEGESRLFSVGMYKDTIVFDDDDGSARFKDKIVVVDTFAVPTLLSTPI